MPHWLLSLPYVAGRRDRTWELLQEKTSSGTMFSSNYKLELPELRVGTLDTLLALSDDLAKVNQSVEMITGKIRRTVVEISGSTAAGNLKVDNLPSEAYLTRFKWDEPKYPSRRPLKETVDKIAEIMVHIEDELKVKLSEFNNLKGQLSAQTRKSTGSLAVRDVSTLVKQEDVIDTENLSSLFVVVSKFSVRDWLDNYERLCDFVVPRSSTKIAEDNDYCLMTAVVFKRVADDFKVAARQHGFQVREYVPPAAPVEGALNSEQLKAEVAGKQGLLESWSKTAYSEAFSCWAHLSMIRLFVESILRYGLPPQFLPVVVKPVDKLEVKLRKLLADAFGTDSSFWKDDGTNTMAGLGGEAELFPYVSISLNVEGS